MSITSLPMSALTLLLACACSTWAADQATAITLQKDDVEFVSQAASGGLFEVQSSELAMKRGVLTDEEKTFAQRMITDHTKVNDELATLAARKNVTVAKTMVPKQQKLYDKLAKTEDKNLAEAYFEDQVSAHKDTISLFEDESKNGKDADLRAFASSHLPTLREHYDHAKRLEKAH